MSGGYGNGQPPTDLAFLIDHLDKIDARLDTLERPSGEQLAQVVAELSALVNDIQAQLDDYIANGTYNKAQIDDLIANPPGNVTTTGRGTFDGGVTSADVKARTLSVGYDSVYIDANNIMGKSPSARRLKQDEADYSHDPVVVDQMQGKTFRLIAAVDELGDDAPVEFGYIADDLAEIGLDMFVRYDPDGQISGLAYERIITVAIDAIKDLRTRVATLEGSSTDDEGI